jgi:hypothetical protein
LSNLIGAPPTRVYNAAEFIQHVYNHDRRRELIALPSRLSNVLDSEALTNCTIQVEDAIIALLRKHTAHLPYTKAVYFDPFNECQNERIEFGDLSLLVRPLMQETSISRSFVSQPITQQTKIIAIVCSSVSWLGITYRGPVMIFMVVRVRLTMA